MGNELDLITTQILQNIVEQIISAPDKSLEIISGAMNEVENFIHMSLIRCNYNDKFSLCLSLGILHSIFVAVYNTIYMGLDLKNIKEAAENLLGSKRKELVIVGQYMLNEINKA